MWQDSTDDMISWHMFFGPFPKSCYDRLLLDEFETILILNQSQMSHKLKDATSSTILKPRIYGKLVRMASILYARI